MNKLAWYYYNFTMFSMFFICGAYVKSELGWSLFALLWGLAMTINRSKVRRSLEINKAP